MRRTQLAIAVSLWIFMGCQRGRMYESHAPLLSASKEQLYQNYDKEVVITGRAETAPHEGVVLVMDDGTRVMIPELSEWPKRAAGQTVAVTGVLQRVPTAITASGGDVTKPDDRFILKGVRWKLGRATTRPL